MEQEEDLGGKLQLLLNIIVHLAFVVNIIRYSKNV